MLAVQYSKFEMNIFSSILTVEIDSVENKLLSFSYFVVGGWYIYHVPLYNYEGSFLFALC